MRPGFLQVYLNAFGRIRGWFEFDAALLFMVFNQFARDSGVPAGDALEIGVYHALSTIAVARLRGPGKRLVVIDPFDNAEDRINVDMYGNCIRDHFDRNFGSFYPKADFLTIFDKSSSEVTAGELGREFSFCHVDGGHSSEQTYKDLQLASEVTLPGGLIALDDYFNLQHPGVSEGAVEFSLKNKGVLKPLVLGYNKVLFQKQGGPAGMHKRFLEFLPAVQYEMVEMWSSPAILLKSRLRDAIDLYASTPEKVVPLGTVGTRAVIRTSVSEIQARGREEVTLDVNVQNVSAEQIPCGESVLGLTYHLLSESGETIRHDNDRAWFLEPLEPGERRLIPLRVSAPAQPGRYTLEVDLVWENVMWFGDIGNPTAKVDLLVA